MNPFKIDRTGNLPLAFQGEQLAEASTWAQSGPGNTRWHELRIYRSDSGRYVLEIAFRTLWENEIDRSDAYVLASPVEVAETVEGYRVVPEGIGYPPGPAYREKQAALESAIRARFARAASDLYAGLDGFAETV